MNRSTPITRRRRFLSSGLALSLLCAFLSGTAYDTACAEVVRLDESADMNAIGVPLYEWRDNAIKEPKAVVIAIHGAAQQGGVLDALGRALASIGYLVVAPDLRGAGRWNTLTHQKSDGTFGDFVRSCEDLTQILKHLKKEYPKSHFFCIGESAGSTVVLSAMVHDASKVKGIILCSAGSEPKLHAPGSMGPEFYHKLMHVTTPVDMSEFMGRYSSDDSRVAAEMVHDPLGRNKLSALELLGTFNFIQQGSVLAGQIPRSLPALLIQGKEDQIINANSSVRLLSKLESSDKNILLLPGCGHILIGTSYVKPIVEEAITDWLAHHGGISVTLSKSMPRSAPPLQKEFHHPSTSSSYVDPQSFADPMPGDRIQPPVDTSSALPLQDYGNTQSTVPPATTQPLTQPQMQPLTQPPTEPVTLPIAQPTTQSTTPPLNLPTTLPTTEPSMQTTETPTQPTTESPLRPSLSP